MKVLLVQSYLGGGEPQVFPLGIACLKAALSGHEVRGFDTNVSARPFDELKETIKAFSPDAIGISLRNIDSTNKRKVVFYYEFLARIIDAVKEVSAAPIIVGGSGFSMFAKEIMADEKRIDYGVFLEGERVLPELLKRLDDPSKVKGIFYRKEGRLIYTGQPPQSEMDSLALPDRSVSDLNAYSAIPDSIGIETKRGCALKCIYCIYGFLNGNRYRLRDPRLIVDDIENVAKRGASSFTFVDSVFNLPKKHSEEICREMIRRGITLKWSGWFSEKGLDGDFVRLVKEAGCKKIILSPDGFSDSTLKELGKNVSKQEILKAYDVLKGIDGYEVCYNFFKNPPGQTLGAFMSLAAFVVKAKREMKRRVHFEFNSMRVEPHTKLYEIALAEGVVQKGDNLLHPKYYTNSRTRVIETMFNLALRLKGR